MKINELCISGYKSIYGERLVFDEKFNVLAGKNNVGKTALIEAIYRGFQGFFTTPNDTNSNLIDDKSGIRNHVFEVSLKIKLEESSEFIDIIGGDSVILKIRSFRGNLSILSIDVESIDGENTKILKWDSLVGEYLTNFHIVGQESINGYPKHFYDFILKIRDSLIFISHNRSQRIEGENVKGVEKLDITAANLQTFLLTLNSNKRKVFIAVEEAFKTIFPDVNFILPSLQDTMTNLKLEFKGIPEPILLQDCGSGYTQVLILLCVLFSEDERIILFDEPQTFLHPYAEREIYKLVSKQRRHQFIFTTHSPVLINYPVRKNLFLVSKEKEYSRYKLMNTTQEVFKEIGASNSDFALAEKVLFVEGDTEKYTLPLILAQFGMEQIGYNYSIVRIRATGNEFKDEQLMIRNANMYNELFATISEQKIPYRIFLDRDERKIERIAKSYGSNLVTTIRRELENYFLNANAIVSIISMYQLSEYPTKEEIEIDLANLLENRNDKKLFPMGCGENPLVDVVGSEVLERVFIKYTIRYNKPEHGRFFTEWLLENTPDDLKEIADVLRDFLS